MQSLCTSKHSETAIANLPYSALLLPVCWLCSFGAASLNESHEAFIWCRQFLHLTCSLRSLRSAQISEIWESVKKSIAFNNHDALLEGLSSLSKEDLLLVFAVEERHLLYNTSSMPMSVQCWFFSMRKMKWKITTKSHRQELTKLWALEILNISGMRISSVNSRTGYTSLHWTGSCYLM